MYSTLSQKISDDLMGRRRLGIEKVMAFARQEGKFCVGNSLSQLFRAGSMRQVGGRDVIVCPDQD